MCHSKCGSGCIPALIAKILLIVGGVNWGLIGLGALMGKGMEAWNVVNMILGSWPTIEAIVYVLVGIAAVMKIFGGCRCKKCMGGCADGSCDSGSMDKKI